MDDNYQAYVNHIAQITLPTHYQHQLANIRTSPKFTDGVIVPFPGYTIITPPCQEDLENQEFYQYLAHLQDDLLTALESNILNPVTKDSFHLTIADLIWNDNYQASISETNNYGEKLQYHIQESFANYKSIFPNPTPISMQLLGLSIFPRAIVACFVPDESGYKRILQLRRSIYQNSGLIALGVEQNYNFIGHITFGYFGNIPDNLNREKLHNSLTKLSDHYLDIPSPIMTISQAQLRFFPDMIHYEREADWPTVAL